MKKIMAMLLVLSLLIAFCACGSNGAESGFGSKVEDIGAFVYTLSTAKSGEIHIIAESKDMGGKTIKNKRDYYWTESFFEAKDEVGPYHFTSNASGYFDKGYLIVSGPYDYPKRIESVRSGDPLFQGLNWLGSMNDIRYAGLDADTILDLLDYESNGEKLFELIDSGHYMLKKGWSRSLYEEHTRVIIDLDNTEIYLDSEKSARICFDFYYNYISSEHIYYTITIDNLNSYSY
ncbi:MAG: hypothetical protein IJR17_06860 [Clostridia bacterium]|nr:hypothetical protein [Clostridia bacterium]